MKIRNLVLVLFSICVVMSAYPVVALSESGCKVLNKGGDLYLAGYVHENEITWPNGAIGGATVLVVSGNKILFEIKTNGDGWFETPRSLSESCVGKNLTILAIAKNYRMYSESNYKIKKNEVGSVYNLYFDEPVIQPNNFIRLGLERIQGRSFADAYSSDVIKSIYGYIYDEEGKAIELSVITFKDSKGEDLGKTISRESGYFDWKFSGLNINKKIKYVVDHEFYDRRSGYYYFDDDLLEQEIIKDDNDKWVLSLGLQFVAYTDSEDRRVNSGRISNDQLVFNVTRFKKLLKKDSSFHSKMSWCWGYDYSLSYSRPYVYDDAGNKSKVEKISLYTLGVGVAWVAKNSSVLVRSGLSASNEEDYGIYFGVSVPFFYLGKIFN